MFVAKGRAITKNCTLSMDENSTIGYLPASVNLCSKVVQLQWNEPSRMATCATVVGAGDFSNIRICRVAGDSLLLA